MPKLPSVCPLDCPDACALHITVEDGVMTALTGSPAHPVTQGFACVKMHSYPARQNHPDRLLYPLRRVGPKGEGRFERLSWDEALGEIAARLGSVIAEHGAEAVLPYCYAGTMGKVEGEQPLAFFRALGASELEQTICATTGGAGFEANYGPGKVGPELDDIAHARFVILWGINSLRSHSHLTPFLKRARAAGAHILHIDPYRNETSRFADESWQIVPGTDAALALALGHVILEEGLEDAEYLSAYANDLTDYRERCAAWPPERAAAFCGLEGHGAERIREVARAFARAKAGFIKVGYGMTRNEGGGNAMRAVTLLPALTGAWRHRGGGASLSTSGSFGLNTSRHSGAHLVQPGVRRVNMNLLASTLETAENPLKALFVFNSNPAAVAPDSSRVRRGLARDDLFTVVLEHFQTDTADYADVLLPATTFLEHTDLYTSYGHHYLQWSEPVLEPAGECRPNSSVFADLARRLGLTDAEIFWSPKEVARELLQGEHPHLSGITFERLKAERSVRLNLPEPYRPYAEGSHFSDRKIRFSPAPEQLAFKENPDAERSLRLISPPGSHLLNTSMGNIPALLKAAGGEPQVVVHPADAERAGLRDGERGRLVSAHGDIVRKIVVSENAREGVAVALGQWWPKLAPDKKSLNDLTGERLTDLGAGSTFGNVTVRLEALTETLRAPAHESQPAPNAL